MRFILVGVGLMLLVIFRPQGIFGNKKELAFVHAIAPKPPAGSRRRAAVAALAGVPPRPGRRQGRPDHHRRPACTRRFGGLTAVDVDHVEIPRDAITALIGPNGAGKTTFFNLLTGFDKPDTGSVDRSTARTLAGIPSYKVARLGRCAPSSSPRRSTC